MRSLAETLPRSSDKTKLELLGGKPVRDHAPVWAPWEVFLYAGASPNYCSSHLQDDRRDGEELARGGELHAVVHLLPVREEAGLPLVGRLEGRPLDRVQQEVHALPTGRRHAVKRQQI